MFIPRGKVIHENLATSYVVVEALVADLCEGGFSGVVEIMLRDTDGYIVISGGKVAAVVEKRSEHDRNAGEVAYTRTTIGQLAERSLRERGRVSIYRYEAATASAVVGRINGEPLYSGLSTEFTDLQKMVWKLTRERDREWFIEISAKSGPSALIHMRDGRCRIINSQEDAPDAESDALDLASNAALRRLLDQCSLSGGTFDVYFKREAEATEAATAAGTFEASASISAPGSARTQVVEQLAEAQGLSRRRAASGALSSNESFISSSAGAERPWLAEQIASSNEMSLSPAASQPGLGVPVEVTPSPAADGYGSASLAAELNDAQAEDSSLSSEGLRAPNDAEAMAEVKRLMGEIARTIEEASLAADHHASFSMCLRAGQLKIADRYSFLDPFGDEFEYLAGEIVFVGQATAEQFIVGLTEALTLALQASLRASAHAERLRAYVTEDLQKLLARTRPEFERFGLDQVIGQLLMDREGSQVGKGGLPPLR